MPNIDIVARLQLRAEQFSSETGVRFAELKTRAASAAQDIRASFNSSFADVQKIAATALVMPRTNAGSLDLSGEIAQLKAAASAADQRAIAMRELSVAQTAAASSAGVDTQALRLDADAAAVASLAAERNAVTIRDRIVALEAVQTELNRTRSLTDIEAASLDASTKSTGRSTAARMEFGHSIRALSDSYAAGIPLTQAITMETGRLAQAAETAGGSLGAVGAFMSTGWGMAAGIALVAFAPLVTKLLEGNDALGDEVEKLKKSADQTLLTAHANDIYAHSLEGLAVAAHKARVELEQQNRSQLENLQLAYGQSEQRLAEDTLKRAEAQRSLNAALLDQRTVVALGAQSSGDASAAAGQVQAELLAQKRVDAARAELTMASTTLANEEAAAAQARIPILNYQAAATDANTAALHRQEETVRALKDAYDAAAAAAYKLGDPKAQKAALDQAAHAYRVGVDQANVDLAAAQKALQEAKRKPHVVSLGDQVEAQRGQALLSTAQSFNGLSENRSGDRVKLEDLFSAANVHVDPKMVAWCAAFVNSVLATNGVSGTGSLAAKSFLGYGTSTDKPEKGDIVVIGQHGNADHVGFYAGQGKNGKVMVTGGNQAGGQVNTEGFPLSQVMAFRRAPTPSAEDKAAESSATRQAALYQHAGDEIARINDQWDAQPRLIDKAAEQSNTLDEIIAKLAQQPVSAETEKLIAAAQEAKGTIEDGLTRPFTDFVRQQHESVAVQSLVLQGRDAEAAALQDALRLQEQGVTIDGQHLAQLVSIERQQKAIADAIDDQRRLVGLYTGTVGDLQHTFDQFLSDFDKKPGAAIGGLFSGVLADFKHLQQSLLSDQLFGGLDHEIEDYVRQRTGGTTPADMLKEQLGDAGTTLHAHVDDLTDEMARVVRSFQEARAGLAAPTSGTPLLSYSGDLAPASPLPSPEFVSSLERSISSAIGLGAANDNGTEIVVTGQRDLTGALNKNTAAHLTATDLYSHLGGEMLGRFEKLIGISLPKTLEDTLGKGLGTLLQGASTGQLGGSVFGALGGQRNNTGEAIGGALGEVAGKSLSKGITSLIGGTLGKTLGSAAGPIGAALGGMLGDVVGGLFTSVKSGSATLGAVNGQAGVTGTSGKYYAAESSAAGGAVSNQLNSIISQLGGTLGNFAVSIGKRGDTYSIDRSGQGKTKGDGPGGDVASGLSLDDAERQALVIAIKDGAVAGISQASQNLLKDGQNLDNKSGQALDDAINAIGQNLDAAIAKAVLVESVPKQLKAITDPVGAAIDDLNTKWDQTVAALKEGGASAEQMAQAQQLYNLQLDQTKNSTDAADQTLKDFQKSLKLGSDSPYSLRDQEGTAAAALQPFIDQITAGQTIDQSKYQDAAQTFLDIERQLYGSTQGYFDALDEIQATTNKAIATVDNATPITSAATDPFGSATATATQATASAVQTGNEIASQSSDLLADLAAKLDQLIALSASNDSGFIGATRAFG